MYNSQSFMKNKFESLKGQDWKMADKLLNYGCWCRLLNQEGYIYDGKIVAGRGAPVDAIDAACKAWHQCRSCRIRDTELSCQRIPTFANWFDEGRVDCYELADGTDCSVSFLI